MFISKQSTQGIQALGVIAGSSHHQSVPTTRLARRIGLCLSSTEIIVRQLKNGGLIRSHRGPGGGYQLQFPVHVLSVWDVVSCFEGTDPPSNADQISPESQAVLALAVELDASVCEHLKTYPLIQVIDQLARLDSDDLDPRPMPTAFHLKPLRQSSPPLSPSWVFDLAKFTQAAHA
jgi:Rrf2 family protein